MVMLMMMAVMAVVAVMTIMPWVLSALRTREQINHAPSSLCIFLGGY
jgi:hypothetical protein